MKKIICVLLVVIGNSCQSTSGFESDCQELDAVDLEMLTIYKSIEKKYKGEERFLKRLQDAQVYWIQYKDRHVRSLYPLEKKYYTDNYSIQYNQCKCKESTKLTKLRAKELKVWLDGPKIEDCPSSIKEP
jgi:uncharacterized protein YecT (DUF1311 family)